MISEKSACRHECERCTSRVASDPRTSAFNWCGNCFEAKDVAQARQLVMDSCERCSYIIRTLTVALVEVNEISSETAVQAEVRTCLGFDPQFLSSHNS